MQVPHNGSARLPSDDIASIIAIFGVDCFMFMIFSLVHYEVYFMLLSADLFGEGGLVEISERNSSRVHD